MARLRIPFLVLVLSLSALAAADYPKDPVADALKAAGKNRAEMQKVLDHYKGDPQKLAAARFLLEHMIGKAYKVVVTVDKAGKDVGFDALKYPSLDAATKAYDELERKHGTLTDKTTPIYDLETLKADFLVEHIDLAFEAWRSLPWAKNVTWETFRDYVLPYRGGKEPAETWRSELMARYASTKDGMKDPTDLFEASNAIGADLGNWVGFWDLYYMHPTEQGFSEMKASRKGRCGDLSNLATMALRSNGIPCAIDYTPYWADTGNNHAWPVTLDANGRAPKGSVAKAAKIYRKTFANHPGNLLYDQRRGESIPPWLNRPDYVDVTQEYLPTADVPFALKGKLAAHAYLCVFNDGEFRPMQWGKVVDGKTTFAAMGLNILYLPATYARDRVVPAGPPFILGAAGRVKPLTCAWSLPSRIELLGTQRGEAQYRLTTGKTYELFAWDGGWKSLGRRTAEGKPLAFDGVPSGGLYWLVEAGSHKEERPFTVEDGAQVWW
jgi:hypothetical protein